jgi:hypothetical protein
MPEPLKEFAMVKNRIRQVCMLALCLGISAAANATFHLWRITQLYSNADGTVQFIELTALASGQQFIAGHTITSSHGATTRSYTFPTILPDDTATSIDGYYGPATTYKSFVIGTQGFAALGVVTPDYVVPNGFLFTANGVVNYAESADIFSYASLPTDGSRALNRNGTTGPNLPQNFAGASGSIAATAPSAVALENPQPGSFQSGIGLISGWSCQGSTIGVAVDGGPQKIAPYGSGRGDTAGVCGATNINTGFGLLFNYNVLGAGTHTAQLYVNGTQRGAPTQFTVTAPGGEFLSGASRQVNVQDFPAPGKTAVLIWQESQQNFAIKSVSP